jgi:hypothetical protein
MRVIYVHFDTTNNLVTVLPAAEVVFAGDDVVWEVGSTSPSVKDVTLEIKGKAKFSFGGSKKAAHSQKLQNGRARIRGAAPNLKKGAKNARYEYTVRGTLGRGKAGIELDPVIIIVPPEPLG